MPLVRSVYAISIYLIVTLTTNRSNETRSFFPYLQLQVATSGVWPNGQVPAIEN